MEIEPYRKVHGSAYQNNYLNSTRPIANRKNHSITSVVSLSEWCDKNFITKRVGRTLIVKKYLIAFRRHGKWWVCANPDCIEQLLEYLGVERLAFDVEQS